MQLDSVDRAILHVMSGNGRITNSELASSVNLSPSACLRRVRALEQSGVILGYKAKLDHAKLGRGTTVFVQISLSSQQETFLDQFESAIAQCPEVVECHLMAGESDYLVQLRCSEVADYERIHRTYLALLPGVARLRTSFALRQVNTTTPGTPIRCRSD